MRRPRLVPATGRLALVCCVAGAAAGGTLSGVALADSSATGAARPAGLASSPIGPSAPTADPAYPKNAAGLTYGSLELAGSQDQAPDLILVEDTAGEEGYVKRVELDAATGADVANPAQAAIWQQQEDALAAAGEHATVTVYDKDGKTAIGQFIVWPSHLEEMGGGS